MSAPERADAALDRSERAARREYGTVVVVGGGCYGSYYLRQLLRASAAGAIRIARILIVDRDPACRVAGERAAIADAGGPPQLHDGAELAAEHHPNPAIDIEIAEWGAFFARWLGAAAADPAGSVGDAIVPSPLMPHLMYEWLVARARERWPGRAVATRPLPRPPDTPWERAAPDGTHYASFATWTCPINCIEPARCPVTRGPRDWTMPLALVRWVEASRAAGENVAGPAVLHCVHRSYGVGMFDVAEVLAADALVRAAGTAGPSQVLVGTVSHCHGALNLLDIGA